MMRDLKYIIFRIGSPGFSLYKAAIFNGMLNHADIAEASLKHKTISIHSAGFCTFRDGKIKCFGRSESLNKGSMPGDADLIMNTIAQV